MAILNANFNADDYVLSSSKRVITCTSNEIVGNFSYRFLLELEYDSKTYSYTFRPNNSQYGLLNITKILQTIVQPTIVQEVLTVPDAVNTTATNNHFQQNIHTMPHQKRDGLAYVPQFLSTGNLGAKRVKATLFDFYSTTATGTPSKQGVGVADFLYVLAGQGLETDLINESFDTYKLTSATKKFISGNYEQISPILNNINVALTDYGTLTFLNRTLQVNTAAETEYIKISYKGSSGITNQTLTNNISNGGEFGIGGIIDGGMLIIAAVYPANLNKLPSSFTRPSDIAGLEYYEVKASNAAGSIIESVSYRFTIKERCEKYDPQRFAYINSLGAWEYITFTEKRTDRRVSKSTKIKGSIFDYDTTFANIQTGYNEKPYVSGVGHTSERIVSSNILESFIINTGYLSISDTKKVEDLFISNLIHYINDDGTARAVLLTSASLPFIKNKNKDYTQTKYTLNFTYSVPTFNNLIY